MRTLLIAIVVVAACGAPAGAPGPASPSPSTQAGSASPAPAAAAPAQAAAPAVTEAVIPLAGGANALWWDAASSTLYLTDSGADALLRWTDRGGLAPVAKLPAGTAGISLGGIVARPDGSRLIASFGFGKQGTLFAVGADGTATALTGLEPARLRIGLAQDVNGVVYSVYFTGRGSAATGGVATIAITGTTASETEIAGGSTGAPLKKLVGVAATPTAVFVSDQAQKIIYRLAVPGYDVSELAHVPAADLLAVMPNGDLLTGGGSSITRITQTGTVTTLAATGFEQVRGLAYDPAGKRLFVVDHSQTVGVPDKLHIVPLAN